jgi:hypothetical protein
MVAAAKYWRYQEMWDALTDWSRRYPDLITVRTLTKSREGRDLPVAAVTDRRTGSADRKPAVLVDANIHAGEVTGNAVAMYWLETLLTQYGTDPLVTDLLRDRAVYVVPRLAVDGAERYLTGPDRIRSSPHLYPDPEPQSGWLSMDVNGDGHILTMRVPAPDGPFRVDPEDPRLMVPRGPLDHEGPFYHVLPEGRLDRRHQAGSRPVWTELRPTRRQGMDFNRNFPVRWAGEEGQPGAGPYPLSEPEIRGLVQFIDDHPNISGYTALHTSGGMILRQPSTGEDTVMNREDLGYYRTVSQMGAKASGYRAVSNWFAFASGHERGFLMPGAADDWAYDTRGILGFTVEIWNLAGRAGAHNLAEHGARAVARLTPEERVADQKKIFAWVDAAVGPEGFHPWTAFDHPDLGPVEIGGLEPKFLLQNPPRAYLEEECRSVSGFLTGLARSTPLLKLGDVRVERVAPGVHRVAVEVMNAGYLPTSGTAKGAELKKARPVTAEILGAKVVHGISPMPLGHLPGYGAGHSGALPARSLAEWTVTAPADGSHVTVIVDGGRAGRIEATVDLDPTPSDANP